MARNKRTKFKAYRQDMSKGGRVGYRRGKTVVDRETGEQIDCTPFRKGAVEQKTVYVDASDLLFKIYCETWDMTQMPAYMFTRTGMKCVDYYDANYLAGLAA